METPSVEELKLREARVQGAEQAISALQEATRALERRAAAFDENMRRIERRQIGNLKWTIGTFLGLSAVLASIGIVILLNQEDERRTLDALIAAEVTATRQGIEAMERNASTQALALEAVKQDTAIALETAAAVSSVVSQLHEQFGEAVRRSDLLLARLSANVDNIRADFAYLVDGGGYRSSFEGQVVIQVPYESTDTGPTGTFLSDVEISVLSSGGQLRAGTLRITVPNHGRIPRQWVTYALNLQFLAALADRIPVASASELHQAPDVRVLMTRFYDTGAWQALVQASVDNDLKDFEIAREPIDLN